MRRSRGRSLFFCGVSLALFAGRLTAQPATEVRQWTDSAIALIKAGTSGLDPAGLDRAIDLLDRALAIAPRDAILLHYRGYALYRRATLMQTSPKPEIKRVLEEADKALEESAKALDWSETFAIRASVFGQLIGVNSGPLAALRYGPKGDAASNRAVALGPDNPRAFLQRGIGNLFKPSLFGGGVGKAERDIRKAIALFATDRPEPPLPSWGHAEAYAWLGQTLERQERFDDARAAYAKALELDPEYRWVKDVLLPALDHRAPEPGPRPPSK